MKNTTAPVKGTNTNVSPSKNQTKIENHKKTAAHLQETAKNHLEAAKHHEAGDSEKAAQSAIKAKENFTLANEAQNEAMKTNSTNSKL